MRPTHAVLCLILSVVVVVLAAPPPALAAGGQPGTGSVAGAPPQHDRGKVGGGPKRPSKPQRAGGSRASDGGKPARDVQRRPAPPKRAAPPPRRRAPDRRNADRPSQRRSSDRYSAPRGARGPRYDPREASREAHRRTMERLSRLRADRDRRRAGDHRRLDRDDGRRRWDRRWPHRRTDRLNDARKRELDDSRLQSRLEELRERLRKRYPGTDDRTAGNNDIRRRLDLRRATESVKRRRPDGLDDEKHDVTLGDGQRPGVPRPIDRTLPHFFFNTCFKGCSWLWWCCDWYCRKYIDRYRYRYYCAPYYHDYGYRYGYSGYRPYTTPTYVTYYAVGYNDSAYATEPCPWTLAEAWDLLAEGRVEEAHEAFACLVTALPEDGVPGIGLALSAVALERDQDGITALREAVEIDPDALRFVPTDERLRSLISAQVDRLEAQARAQFGDLDALFATAALRFMLGQLPAAHYSIKAARTLGDADPSALILEIVIEMEMGIDDRAPRPDSP